MTGLRRAGFAVQGIKMICITSEVEKSIKKERKITWVIHTITRKKEA